METEAGHRWREQLAGWAIPNHILEAGDHSPWAMPSGCFAPGASPSTSATTERCAEVLGGGTVLDVGVGGGRASLHLPASRIIGVDVRPHLLELAVSEAKRHRIDFEPIVGEWPEVAGRVGCADLVVSSHVVYNVAEIESFVDALASHARKRVVLELDAAHPMCRIREAWWAFWELDRPDGPTWHDLADVLRSLGVETASVLTQVPAHKTEVTPDEVARLRTRLCLPEGRDPEVESWLSRQPRQPRSVVTLWWDTT